MPESTAILNQVIRVVNDASGVRIGVLTIDNPIHPGSGTRTYKDAQGILNAVFTVTGQTPLLRAATTQ